MHDEFVAMGKEGAVIRDNSALYETSRSFGVMKLKQLFSDEFDVLSLTCGTKGKDEGLLMWNLVTKQGKTFTVRPNMTDQKRKEEYLRLRN
jgi:ATP-dependent DNA ligase